MIPHALLFLAVAGEEPSDKSTDIYLNRSGINSIEVPPENARVETGGTLRLNLINRGAPIHITVTSSNAGMFTNFFHENMYVVDEKALAIPLKKDCQPGFFDLEIIAGYGAMKASFRVEVGVKSARGPQSRDAEVPLQPVAQGRPHLLMVVLAISLVLYSSWYYTGISFLNTAAFITFVAGALYVWYRQK